MATPIKTVEREVMPSVSAELLLLHERPAPPADGSPTELLNHAVEYGSWANTLWAQVKGWQEWYQYKNLTK